MDRPSRIESAPLIWSNFVFPFKATMLSLFTLLSLAVVGCGAIAPHCSEPVPTITNINPDHAQLGVLPFVLTVRGTGFVTRSRVFWNSNMLATTYIDSTQLRAVVPLEDLTKAGTASIDVFNPPPADSAGR